MLANKEILASVKGKTECHYNIAASLVMHIVTSRLAGNELPAEAISDFVQEHSLSDDDLAIIQDAAESLAVANGAPIVPKIISAVDLCGKVIPPPTWIIENLLPAGLTILAGNPKAGKSWLALDLAIAAASGGELFGELDCETARDVLYLALEDTEFRLQSRLNKLLTGDKPPPSLYYSTAWPRTDQGGLKHLSEWVSSHTNAGLIIIDTLQMIRPAHAKNGSVYAEDYKAIHTLKQLADAHKLAVVVVHHLRKAKSSDPFEKISGSYGLTGAADTNAVLERDPSTSHASLHIRGRDVGDTEFALVFDKDLGRWQLLGECELPATQSQMAILTAVKTVPLSPKEIAEKIGADVKHVHNLLPKLVKKMAVVKQGYGKYISAAYELEKTL